MTSVERLLIRAYDSSYLDDVRDNLGTMLDFAVNTCFYDLKDFYLWFLMTGVSDLIAEGRPRYLAGMSGIDLADTVVSRTGQLLTDHQPYIMDSCSAEYWTGWALAYVQWYTGMSFKALDRYGINAEVLIQLYPTLHEADDSKLLDVALKRIEKSRSEQTGTLVGLRKRKGLTQAELAEASGVSLRMIRAYEQNTQDLSRAESMTVLNLSRVLSCSVSDLLGV